MSLDADAAELQAAWSDFVAGLNRGRDALDSPELHAPPPSERLLAEGYRYLLGFTFSAIERAFGEDPDFPYFRRAIQPMDKATIDNADALYLTAVIDGTRTYRITGEVADHAHWTGGPRAPVGPWAPQYLIVEVHSHYVGDTGSIVELAPGGRSITGTVDSTELVVTDGRFEMVVGPERPAGHEGSFLSTRTEDGADPVGTYVVVRVLYHDWENEVAPTLSITPVSPGPLHPVPAAPDGVAARLRRAGLIVENQMRFWNEFYDVVCGAFGEGNPQALAPMSRNGVNTPTNAQLATGGGQSTNVYAGGRFHLGRDEALLVEVSTPVGAAYQGLHLSNLWGESFDYANHVTSLNGFQAVPDPDGVCRYVVSHRDPGVPNWLDTTGHDEGLLAFRWTYPSPPDQMPTVVAAKVRVGELAGLLPAGVPLVSPSEREAQIRVRQAHVQRRYRQY